MKTALALSALIFVAPMAAAEDAPTRPIVIASKNFNENYILAEMMAQILEADGFAVERRFGLGGTLICYEALLSGEVDVYPEYSGTVEQAILKLSGAASIDELNAALGSEGVALLAPFGFNNTYAVAVREAVAAERGLTKLSELLGHRDLRIVVSHEFLERDDGWPGLQKTYGFDWLPEGIEHGLAYQAIADGTIDVTDAYSTDGELERYVLRVLDDDRDFFPTYLAAPFVRNDLPARAQTALNQLAGTLDDAGMAGLNAAVLFEGEDFASAATKHLTAIGVDLGARSDVQTSALGRNVVRHLLLTGIALVSATVVGMVISLGVFRTPWLSRAIVYIAGLMQTIPSIALLALMIPLLGIGIVPAIVALFLYSLLPIIRSSVTALATVDPVLQRVATAMGLSTYQQVRLVFVPMAMPNILAGIRTAAVISIGTATLAAFIGAGGLGDPIVTGLSLNDTNLILQGALPAAGLAVATELVFEGVERLLIPGHLKVMDQT